MEEKKRLIRRSDSMLENAQPKATFTPIKIKGNGMVLHPKTKAILIKFDENGEYEIKTQKNFDEINSLCPKYLK